MDEKNCVKYLFFDLDGTLIDSMKYHISSWQDALEKYHIPARNVDFKKLGGVTFRESAEILAKEYKIDLTEDLRKKISKTKLDYFEKSFKPELFPGVKKNLKLLKKNGYKLALVTGTYKKKVIEIVDLKFKDIFDVIITSDDVVKGKPHPESFLLAKKHFKAKSVECLVIEDSICGIHSGKKAKLKVLALETTLKKKDLVDADMVFKDHEQLFSYLLKL